MKIAQSNKLGNINISLDAIATLAGSIASSVYGVVGLVNKRAFVNPLNQILKIEDYQDGVSVKKVKSGYEISLYIVLAKDIKISEVIYEVSKQVSYSLEKNFGIPFKTINIYVQALN